MRYYHWVAVILLAGLLTGAGPERHTPLEVEPRRLLIDDFESYRPGSLPTRWKYFHNNELVDVSPRFVNEREKFYVGEERGNKFLRMFTEGEAQHLTIANQQGGVLDWDLTTHPRLAWDWRGIRLPAGAREDRNHLNDSGAGLYVIFAIDGILVRQPRAIKYTYSSTLPVGTVVSYGKLRVLVVASAVDGYGQWKHVERDVLADYRRLFGGEPPQRPVSIRLWADSDNTGLIAEADFDNITLLPAR